MSINKKGEIATIITLGSLIILGLASLVTTVVNKKPRSTQTKAAGCASVSGISYSPSPVKAGQVFTCSYNSSGSPYTMACGWSKNGGWPQGQKSGKCSGGRCSFEVQMEEQIDPNATYELVGFDFRTECGPSTGQKTALTVEGAAAPQPTSPGCQGECCGKPNGYIAKQAVKMACDSGLGRYVIIDQVCENGNLIDKPSCATCRECKAGDQPIAPVPGADLAVNECTGGCKKKDEGVCAGLPECAPNVTPVIVRNCIDTTGNFSCPASSPNACQKNGAIWCYGSGGGGSSEGGGKTPPSPKSPDSPTIPPGKAGGECTPCEPCSSHGCSWCCEGNLVCVNKICVTPTPISCESYNTDKNSCYKLKDENGTPLCNYFETGRDGTPCNKCVPRGTRIEDACPPTSPEKTCLATSKRIYFPSKKEASCYVENDSGGGMFLPCGKDVTVPNVHEPPGSKCVIFRMCPRKGVECVYDCYKDNVNYNCFGALDAKTYDVIRIYNSSTTPRTPEYLKIEKYMPGPGPFENTKLISYPVTTLKQDDLQNYDPNKNKKIDRGEVWEINLDERGLGCAGFSFNEIRAYLKLEGMPGFLTGQNSCAFGVKILINIQ